MNSPTLDPWTIFGRSFAACLRPNFIFISKARSLRPHCIMLMMGLEVLTWEAFFIWLIAGLMIYFFYSRHRSEFAGMR